MENADTNFNSELFADEERLMRFAEDAWRELKAIGRRDVFLYGYLEQEAAALGLEDGR